MTRVLVIDPHKREIEMADVPALESNLQVLLDADRVECLNPDQGIDKLWVNSDHWTENEQAFFLIGGYGWPIGGRAAIVLDDASQATVAGLASAVLWANLRFQGIKREMVGDYQHPVFGPMNTFVEFPDFEILGEAVSASVPAPAEPEKVVPRAAWVIYREQDGFTAHGFKQGSSRAFVILENEDLDTLRGMIPEGLSLVPRSDADATDVVESWI